MVLLENFFDLEKLLYEKLFQHKEKAKELFSALVRLPSFLKTLPLGRIHSKIPRGAVLENPDAIYIGKNVSIDSCSLIRGPCYIENNCCIRHGAFLRGNVFLSEGSVVGHTTEVKNAIFLKNAAAAHFAYVGDSILGSKANLGAGVKCANLKLNQEEIVLFTESGKIKTGLKKLGAIIGDGVQIGCNSVLNPGTIIGRQAIVYPALNTGGFIPAKSIVKPSSLPRIIVRKKTHKTR